MVERIAIIGGNGFIGRNAVSYFSTLYDVYTLDKTPSNSCEPSNPSRFINVNTRNKSDLFHVLKIIDPHYILHLASKSTVIECYEDPEEAFLDNVLGCLNVLSICRTLSSKFSLRMLLVHTSDKVYGEHPEEALPYLETHPHYRADPYSTSKAAQDMISLCWAEHCHVPVSTIRSGNIYGPWDFNFSRLIPQTIQRLLQRKAPIIYEGQATTKRDFVYVDDVIQAYQCIFLQGQPMEAFNIGGNGPVMVCEVIAGIKHIMNLDDLETTVIKRQLPEFKAQYLDATKIKALGWTARTSLIAGLQKCVDFYTHNLSKAQLVSNCINSQ